MRTLKAYLAVLLLGTVLPGLLFGVGTSWWLAAEMRLNTEKEAERLVDDAAADIAEHIGLVTTAMKALARSPALQSTNLTESYRFAVLLAADLGQHIGLATADGRQIFNTRRPLGEKLPRRTNDVSYKRALATGQPSVSDVIVGAIAQRPLITIDIPLTRPGGPMVLGTSTDVGVISEVAQRTTLKPGWKMAVIDGEGRFISRNVNPEAYVGKLAVPDVIAVAKSDSPRGWVSHRTHEGVDLVSVYAKIPGTSWTVLIGTPEPMLMAPLRGPLATLATAAALAIALTLLVALTLGKRLNLAAHRLSEAARAIGDGAEPLAPDRSIAEFERVGTMLGKAARLIRDKQSELIAARDAAERSAESKVRFFAAASHDLRQPLQASVLFIDSLRPTIASAHQQRILDRLDMAHASMSNLVNALLDLARIDCGSQALTSSTVVVADLLDEIVAECQPLAEVKGLVLRCHLGPPGAVMATDRMLLGRIVRNLVHNAIRYTEAGGVLVAARQRGSGVCIEVWDSGIGIPPEHLDLIWEEFYQIGNSSRDQSKGLGLGLAIVWRLVRQLGLAVEVKSRLGRGSMFRIAMGDGGSAAGLLKRGHALDVAAEDIGNPAALGPA